jgi:predicted regulator of Ras-like GTPase activity (Roadblock/LC7/MglB family)
MQETLKKIVEDTPGAKGAILMGFDGIAVDQYMAEGAEDTDIESMAMEFSFRFIELRNAAESLELGDLSDIAIKAEHGTFLVRCLGPEYFVAVLLGSAGHFGKGRWMLRSSASSLVSEL